MSRKNYRNSSRRKQTNQIQEIPHELQEVYGEFSRAVKSAEERARVNAGPSGDPSNYTDYREAIQLLNSHPTLTTFLETVMERKAARDQALGVAPIPHAASGYAVPGFEDSFYGYTQKAGRHGPPTGSHPQGGSGVSGGWATGGNNKDVPQGISNATTLRYFADNNEWVRSAINIRRQQVGRADIAVIPANERKVWNRGILKKVERLLTQPNIYRDSYRSLIEPVIEDILVLDRGCISKNMSVGRVPTELYFEDGASIKIYTSWDGNPKNPRYLYEEPGTNVKVPLRNDELICIQANPATYRVGLSPVQFLRKTIQAEMRAIESANHIVEMKPAPHIVQIPGAHQTQITNLRNNYDAEVAGRKELFWMGGDAEAKVFNLTFSARDNQWLEWQQWLARKIATAFQISLQQLNFTDAINKSTGEVQQELYEDTGLIPLLLLVEEYMNSEVLMDYAPIDRYGLAVMDALNLRIVYPEISEAERVLHAEKSAEMAQKMLGGLPGATINQILMMRGEEPVAGGNTFWIKTATGAVPFLSYDHDYGDWSPLASLGGMLGAQDPLTGPEEEEDDPDSGPNEKQEPVGTPPASSGGKSGKSGKGGKAKDTGTSLGDSTSAGNTEGVNTDALTASIEPVTVKTHRRADTRKPGKRWTPGAQLLYSTQED